MSETTTNVAEPTPDAPRTTPDTPEATSDTPEAATDTPEANATESETSAVEVVAEPAAEVATEPEASESADSSASTEQAPVTPEYQRPAAIPGFEEVTSAWWDAVIEVHEVLLRGDADLEEVSGAFNRELRARWDYARTLHSRGYLVPAYLAERAPVAPLWPLPELPAPARSIARAA